MRISGGGIYWVKKHAGVTQACKVLEAATQALSPTESSMRGARHSNETRYSNASVLVIKSSCNVVQGRHERLFHIGAVGMHPSVPESAKPAANGPHR